jgi:hypothetical protein
MQDNSYYDTQPNGGMPNMINPLGMAMSLTMPGISSFYKFVDLIVSKSVSDFTLEYPKLMFHLAPLMVAECTNEYMKNSMLNALTRYMVAMLSPIIRDLEYSDFSEEDIENFRTRFEDLKGHSSACSNVKIESKIERSGQSYTKYNFTTHHSSSPITKEETPNQNTKNPRPDMLPLSGVVECSEYAVSLGLGIARDNGYNRINCSAENTLTDVLSLASDLRIISVNDNLMFSQSSVSPGDVEDRVIRQRVIKDREKEPSIKDKKEELREKLMRTKKSRKQEELEESDDSEESDGDN